MKHNEFFYKVFPERTVFASTLSKPLVTERLQLGRVGVFS